MQINLKPKTNYVNLISRLFHARTQLHIYHLQTSSYAQHIALNEMYDGILTFADSIAEAMQGKDGMLRGYTSYPFAEDNAPVPFLESLRKEVNKFRLTLDKDCENIDNEIQSLMTLIDSTLYKLKFLH